MNSQSSIKKTKLLGEKIRLLPLQKTDLPNRVKWFNDPDVNKALFLDELFDFEKTKKWFKKTQKDDSRIDFLIETKDGVPIGCAGLVNINRTHQTAESYCVIGDENYWGKGIGTEAHRLLFEYAFDKLGIEKIWADINPKNSAIIKVIEKLGFKQEGLLRKDRIIAGQRVDVLRIGLLKEEFIR